MLTGQGVAGKLEWKQEDAVMIFANSAKLRVLALLLGLLTIAFPAYLNLLPVASAVEVVGKMHHRVEAVGAPSYLSILEAQRQDPGKIAGGHKSLPAKGLTASAFSAMSRTEHHHTARATNLNSRGLWLVYRSLLI